MSLFTVNRAILPSVWPNNLGRPSTHPGDLQVRNSWRFIPEHADDLYDWATVVDDEAGCLDGRVSRRLVYKSSVLPAGVEHEAFEVSVVLQGFVRGHSLGILGNWSGRERDAPQASQFLKLDGGGNVIFDVQRRGLDNIRRLAHLHIGGEADAYDADDSIVLRRPVFTKVRATGAQDPAVVLNDSNDPFGSARKISRRWRIDHVVQTFVRRPNGTNVKVAAEAFQVGDFVETTVTANIRIVRSRKQRKTVVEFHMQDVIRLWSAKEAKKICESPSDHPEPPMAGPSRASVVVQKVASLLERNDDGTEGAFMMD